MSTSTVITYIKNVLEPIIDRALERECFAVIVPLASDIDNRTLLNVFGDLHSYRTHITRVDKTQLQAHIKNPEKITASDLIICGKNPDSYWQIVQALFVCLDISVPPKACSPQPEPTEIPEYLLIYDSDG